MTQLNPDDAVNKLEDAGFLAHFHDTGQIVAFYWGGRLVITSDDHLFDEQIINDVCSKNSFTKEI